MTLSATATPFSEPQWQQVQTLLRNLDQRQALWLSGYLAASDNARTQPQPASQGSGSNILIAHGGETGNSRSLALALAEQARSAGIAADVEDLAQLRLRQLAKRSHLLLICSTHGDGDPPEPVIPFYEALMADNAPRLESLQFSVLALGDSTYEHFCVTGRQLDQRLEELGATRLHPRQDCDVDFAQPAETWGQSVLEKLPKDKLSQDNTEILPVTESTTLQTTEYSKQNPLSVEILENINLSTPQRQTAIHHIELALEVADFHLSPGDAIGMLADNPPALVAAVLDACSLSGEAAVSVDGESMPLVQALRQHRDLTIPSARFLEFWATLSHDETLLSQAAAATREQRQFLKQVQILDLITQTPAKPEPQALVDALRPLQPRLYDVANSLNVLTDELHLSVKTYRYPFGTRTETGIASQYLLTQEPGDYLRIYPHRNSRFHLPEEQEAPIILIGEGTGIAPYRAFIQEQEHSQIQRSCWLVFAEQQFEQDFLYQSELQQAHSKGVLQHVDAVFYQDHPDDTLASPLLRQINRLNEWLAQGAHVYFCGDKQRLSDCEKQLAEQLGDDIWKSLGKAKRIHRNLY